MSETEHSTDIELSLESIVEAILFAAGKPMMPEHIIAVFPENERPEVSEVKLALDNIGEDYDNRGIELQKVASGYRFQVRQQLAPWVVGLWGEKAPRYTRALLETLALIVYRQPVTRGEIEDIRGVSVSSNIMRTLQEREWVRVVGRRDVPGRPAMYATTRQFLDYFNLSNLNELPPLGEIRDLEAIAEKLEVGLQQELKGISSAIHKNEAGDDQTAEEEQAIVKAKDLQVPIGQEQAALVDHEAVKALKEEKDKADFDVFSTVDELLASVKTDFTDFASEEAPEVTSVANDEALNDQGMAAEKKEVS